MGEAGEGQAEGFQRGGCGCGQQEGKAGGAHGVELEPPRGDGGRDDGHRDHVLAKMREGATQEPDSRGEGLVSSFPALRAAGSALPLAALGCGTLALAGLLVEVALSFGQFEAGRAFGDP
ncbi:hypothetical protein [Amycolatopsis aidingensis]|uniref:hypothetical protein n=1 Tax=Amycolatopsis aidingensis TaxID=2842453 RepID=UPI001E2C5BC9|nr:hypothetical protein [Amycolatopsis aidingensis]